MWQIKLGFAATCEPSNLTAIVSVRPGPYMYSQQSSGGKQPVHMLLADMSEG